jgi:(1->4)-alpha-D-glucan 1-alpha-D-glucosylmutase
VAGTTGYDFLGSVNGLFVDRSTWRQMTGVYTRFAGRVEPMAELTYVAKRLIMQVSMASEIAQLGLHLDRISERNRLSRDFTLASLVRAIREIIAAFPVYRTYVGDLLDEPSQRDRGYIDRAMAEARRRNPTVSASIFDFLRDALLTHHSERSDEQERAERRRFTMRFQQTTGPVTAKGVEDTALYLYNRLVSLNEVGSDPARYGEAVSTFHEKNQRRLQRWPDSLLGTSTHDTKRGEDVRARISVLSEIPGTWATHVRRWRMLNRRFKREQDGQSAPDRNDEYLLYQTLVGAWPVRPEDEAAEPLTARLTAYMEKATKEAKRRTSWVNPDAEYDRALREFVSRILAADSPFREVFLPFQRLVAVHGAVNSLAQTLLKIASPGIPDFYQGSELWDLSLVDPDNRRPVDFSARQELLNGLREGLPPCAELLGSWRDGRVKLLVTQRALTLRRELAGLFRSGAYQALAAGGERADHVVAFARHDPEHAVIVAVPRLSARLTGFNGEWPLGPSVWGDTWLSIEQPELGGEYVDRLSGLRIAPELRDGKPALSLGKLFEALPVTMLRRETRT